MEEKPYTITDRRGMESGQEHPEEVCRVCGSKEVHSKQYGKPTTECITYLKNQIKLLGEATKEISKLNESAKTRLDAFDTGSDIQYNKNNVLSMLNLISFELQRTS